MEPATILVIDDQECVRLLLKLVLEHAGLHVNEATNGRHGLELFREYPADLVIADIAMPEMNGLDFMLELTKAFLDVKVIAMTGASSEALQKAKLLGARQIFQKPFNTQALLRAVQCSMNYAIRCSRSRRSRRRTAPAGLASKAGTCCRDRLIGTGHRLICPNHLRSLLSPRQTPPSPAGMLQGRRLSHHSP